jgi:regulator of replication initiation timing
MVTLSEFLRHTTKLTQEVGVAKRERDGLRMECKCLTEENGKLRRNLEAEKEKVSACAGSMTKALIKANAKNDALAARVAELEAANGGNLQAAIDGFLQRFGGRPRRGGRGGEGGGA